MYSLNKLIKGILSALAFSLLLPLLFTSQLLANTAPTFTIDNYFPSQKTVTPLEGGATNVFRLNIKNWGLKTQANIDTIKV